MPFDLKLFATLALVKKGKAQIAFYCSSVSWGGLEMNILDRALWLKQAGLYVHLFCVANSPLHQKALKVGLNLVLVKRNQKWAGLYDTWQIKKAFSQRHIDAVFITDNRDISLFARLKQLGERQLKVLFLQAMQLGVAKRDLIHTLRFKAIDAWIAPLPYLADQVRSQTRFPSERIHVIPLGIPAHRVIRTISQMEARAYFKIKSDVPLIGLIGRIDPLKGQHLLIEALEILVQSGHRAEVLIMGDSTLNEGSEYRLQLDKQIQEANLEQLVHFQPFQEDVAPFFAAIDIFVLASKAETYGMVTIEALMAGKLVVGSNASGTPELLENGLYGKLYRPNDSNAMAEALAEVLDNPAQSAEMAQRAQSMSQRQYSAQKETEALQNLLTEILKEA